MSGTNGQLTRSNQSAAENRFFGRKFGLAPSAGIFAPGSPFPVSVTRISKVSSVGITQLFSTTWNITAPVGVAAGHLLISVMVHNTASAVTLPSGWTLLFNVDYVGPRRVTIAYKIATATEPEPARDSYTFTLGAAGDGAHVIAAYRGVNQTTPIDTSANTPTSTSVDITLPSITTTINNAMLLWIASDNNGNTLGAPAGTKVVSEMFNATAFSRIWLAEEFDATLGATGTRVATTGGASVNWAAASIALAPAYAIRTVGFYATESGDTLSASASVTTNLSASVSEARDTLSASVLTTPIVQSAIGIFNGTVSSSVSFSGTVTAGNFVVVAIGAWKTGGLPAMTVTDNQGNTYTQRGQKLTAGTDAGAYCYVAYNVAASGTFTVTVAPATASDITVAIAEFSGVLASGDPYEAGVTAIGTSTAADTGNVATTTASDLLIGVLSHAGSNATLTEGGTWTLVRENEGGSTNAPVSLIYKTAGAAGNYNATWTISTAPTWLVIIDAFKPSSTGINLTLAATEYGDTVSASASASTNLSAAITESPDTIASSASVALNLTLAKTESADTLVSTASVSTNLSAALVESSDTLSSSASASVNLTLAATESADTLSSAVSASINLTLAKTESPDTVSASASVSANLSAAVTESPDTVSSSASASVNITAAITEAPDTLASSASVSTNLTLAKTESTDTLSASASASTNLSAAVTESPDTLAAPVSASINTALSAAESPDSLSASASVALNLSFAVTESPDSLAAVISVSGLAERVLTFAVTESPDTIAASASVGALPTRTIDAILIELPDTLASSASVSVGASLGVTEQGDTLTASASVALNLSLSVTESPDTLASSASVSALSERVLTFAVVESPDTLIAAAIVSAFATRILTLAITEAPDTLSAGAVGDVTIPFTSVHASITQRGVGTLIVARVATPAIIQRVPSVGVVRAGAQGRITQPGIRVAISQDP